MSWLQRWVLDGGIMMFVLIPCSVIALAHIVQGLIALRRERLVPSPLQRLAESARDPIEAEAAHRRLAADPSPLAHVVEELHRLTPRNPEDLEREAVRLAGEEALLLYHRRVAPLALMRNLSLYVGLLGTVLGIMNAFGQYVTGAQPDVAQLGRGVAEALVTTAWGLAIAIPSMVFVHHFRQRLIALERVRLPEAALAIHRRLEAAQRAAVPAAVAGRA